MQDQIKYSHLIIFLEIHQFSIGILIFSNFFYLLVSSTSKYLSPNRTAFKVWNIQTVLFLCNHFLLFFLQHSILGLLWFVICDLWNSIQTQMHNGLVSESWIKRVPSISQIYPGCSADCFSWLRLSELAIMNTRKVLEENYKEKHPVRLHYCKSVSDKVPYLQICSGFLFYRPCLLTWSASQGHLDMDFWRLRWVSCWVCVWTLAVRKFPD